MKIQSIVFAISILLISGCARNRVQSNIQVAAQLYDESKIALNNSELELAASLIDSAITINPLNANYYGVYGIILSDQDDHERAVSMLRQSIERDTVLSTSKILRLADEYGKLADQRRKDGENFQEVCYEGIAFMQEFFKNSPNHDCCYTCLGTCYFALGEADSAEAFFVAAIKSNKTKLCNYQKLGELYYSTLRLDRAKAIFQAALKIDDSDKNAIVWLRHIRVVELAIRIHEDDPNNSEKLSALSDELVKGVRLVSSVGLPYQDIWEDELWIHVNEIYLGN